MADIEGIDFDPEPFTMALMVSTRFSGSRDNPGEALMRNSYSFLILALGLVTASAAFGKLPEISDQEAAKCEALGDITASSGYGKNPNWQPIARTYAEKKAEGLGATHIAPIQFKAAGSFNGEAKTKAYRCP